MSEHIELILGLGCIVVAGIIGIAIHARKKQTVNAQPQSSKDNDENFPRTIPYVGKVQGDEVEKLDFGNVVGWFKCIPNFNKEKHIPFIANANSPEFKKIIDFGSTEKKYAIFIGVYDEDSEKIIKHHLILTDTVDSKTEQVLGNEPLVVLN